MCLWGVVGGKLQNVTIAKGGTLVDFVFLRDSGVQSRTQQRHPRLALYDLIATDLGMKLGQGLSKISVAESHRRFFFPGRGNSARYSEVIGADSVRSLSRCVVFVVKTN